MLLEFFLVNTLIIIKDFSKKCMIDAIAIVCKYLASYLE